MKSIAVFLAPGFEEIEAVTIIDVLRRAELKVTVAGLTEGLITGSHDITIQPDTTLEKIRPEAFDMVVLPGGIPGTDHLREDPRVIDFLQEIRSIQYLSQIVVFVDNLLYQVQLSHVRLQESPGGF